MRYTPHLLLKPPFVFPEAPRWFHDTFYFCDIDAGMIYGIGQDGTAQALYVHGSPVSGWVRLEDGSLQVVAGLDSVAVFLNGDLKSAQRLIGEEVTFRELEMRYAESHLHRLSENTPQSVETSSLHLDLLSDFKRINSLFCSVSHPILESAGVLSKTRVLGEQPGLFNTNQSAAS